MAQETEGKNGKAGTAKDKSSAPAKEPISKKSAPGKKGAAPEKGAAKEPQPKTQTGPTRKKTLVPEKDAEPEQRSAPRKPAAPAKDSKGPKTAGRTTERAHKKVEADKSHLAPQQAPASQPVPREKPTASSPEPAREPLSENPLHRKLGLRPGITGLVIAPPEDSDNPLLPLPDGFHLLSDVEALASFEGLVDYLHFFSRNRAELARVIVRLRDTLAPGGSLWVSWIKQSSSRRGEGLPGDLNENVIRRLALTSGLVDVKVAALDQDWSALRLVHRKH